MTVALIPCGFLTRAQVTYAEWTRGIKTCFPSWESTANSSCFSAVCSLRFSTCLSRLLQLLFLDHSRSEKTEFTGRETLIRSRFLHELSRELTSFLLYFQSLLECTQYTVSGMEIAVYDTV